MIDHLSLNVSNFRRSLNFYRKTLAPIGYHLLMEYHGNVAGFGIGHKLDFWIAKKRPYHKGIHIAFEVSSRALVDDFYKAALEAGGTDNGKPGVRPDYHPSYYAAFIMDPEGNNIEAVCHHVW